MHRKIEKIPKKNVVYSKRGVTFLQKRWLDLRVVQRLKIVDVVTR